jgi:hypothetical protein
MLLKENYLEYLQQLSIWLPIWECGESKYKNDAPTALYFTLLYRQIATVTFHK